MSEPVDDPCACLAEGKVSPQLQAEFARHNFHTVSFENQDKDNVPLEEIHFDPEVFAHLKRIGAKNGDQISIERKDEEIPFSVVDDMLVKLDILKKGEAMQDKHKALLNFALHVLGQKVLEKVKFKDDKHTTLIANYSHHAILMSHGCVVQFATHAGDWSTAEEASVHYHEFSKFLGGSEIKNVTVKKHDNAAPRFITSVIALAAVETARKSNGVQCKYALLQNNCEHFACSLRTGVHISALHCTA